MDFILGAIACACVVIVVGIIKKGVINRFRNIEIDIDDLNELVSEIVSGSDE